MAMITEENTTLLNTTPSFLTHAIWQSPFNSSESRSLMSTVGAWTMSTAQEHYPRPRRSDPVLTFDSGYVSDPQTVCPTKGSERLRVPLVSLKIKQTSRCHPCVRVCQAGRRHLKSDISERWSCGMFAACATTPRRARGACVTRWFPFSK
jgi:hypothetical protein